MQELGLDGSVGRASIAILYSNQPHLSQSLVLGTSTRSLTIQSSVSLLLKRVVRGFFPAGNHPCFMLHISPVGKTIGHVFSP